jgi:hypothetical protein
MPPVKYYVKDTVVRLSKNNFDSVVRCFFYSVLTLRCYKTVRIEQENVPGTDVWFPVPRGEASVDALEKHVKDFTDAVMKGKPALADSGTIMVTKYKTERYLGFMSYREEFERWHFNYQIDVLVDPEQLAKQLVAMMQELSNSSLVDGQQGAAEEAAEFDVQFSV